MVSTRLPNAATDSLFLSGISRPPSHAPDGEQPVDPHSDQEHDQVTPSTKVPRRQSSGR
jgi:hypothetical protein